MSMTKMNIPKTITVGYQKRTDTYTGKLAYVIYTDTKGKLRKEKSWEGWRQKSIKPENFLNEPTSGFVLNKGVGGVKGSWSSRNVRNEYIRIYDPRGFEFEISVANLLYILQECTSAKGKGLEGDFVYAWDGKDLVLLPTSSVEYEECSNYSSKQSKKVTKAEMVEGYTYKTKEMCDVVYLGRHGFIKHGYTGAKVLGKKHIFKPISAGFCGSWDCNGYNVESGFTKLAETVSEEVHPDFSHMYKQLMRSEYCGEIKEIEIQEEGITGAYMTRKASGRHTSMKQLHRIVEINGKYHQAEMRGTSSSSWVDDKGKGHQHRPWDSERTYSQVEKKSVYLRYVDKEFDFAIKNGKHEVKKSHEIITEDSGWRRRKKNATGKYFSIKEWNESGIKVFIPRYVTSTNKKIKMLNKDYT